MAKWKLDWQVNLNLSLYQLEEIVEHVTGYGAVTIEHEAGLPKILHAEFQTTQEWDEFDLAKALAETSAQIGAATPGRSFPTRPYRSED